MWIRGLVLAVVFVVSGCVHAVSPEERAYQEAQASCMRGEQPQPTYFPPTVAWQEHRTCWYSAQLKAAGEAPLWPVNSSVDSFRFTWLRTFDHPIVVRVDHSEGTTRATLVELNGAGGYWPGKVLRQYTEGVPEAVWKQLMGESEALGFWGASPSIDERIGVDGAEWIVEGTRHGAYRAVSVWSPDEKRDPGFRAFCMHLFAASGWRMPGPLY